jgi:hypothetical protein
MDIVVSGTLNFKALGISERPQRRILGRIARPANACRGERILLKNPRALQKYCKFRRRDAFLYRRVGEFGKWSAARPFKPDGARGET